MRGEIADDKQDEHRSKDHCGECVHRRLDASAHFAVNQGRQGVDAGSSCKVGDDEIIEGHRECEQKAGEHTRKNVRENDLEKRAERACAEVKRGFVGKSACLFEFWHDAQDHIWNVEGDMGDQNRLKSEGDAKCNERKHQGDTGHDVGIEHRDICDSHQNRARNRLHAVDRDRSRSSDDDGDQCR